MDWSFVFFLNSVFLGVGLAMDAFSVSVANGLADPGMKAGKICTVAGVFGFFQALMPLIGRLCVRTIADRFAWFETCIPWIALGLLGFLGVKMLIDGIRERGQASATAALTFSALLVQGVATSIDALSVGFTIADYGVWQAVVCAALIAAVTFLLCLVGVGVGKKLGNRISGYATAVGGVILIAIGIEIFLSHVL